MKLLFTPAIALMNRMGYNKKFAVLWLMCQGAISVLLYKGAAFWAWLPVKRAQG